MYKNGVRSIKGWIYTLGVNRVGESTNIGVSLNKVRFQFLTSQGLLIAVKEYTVEEVNVCPKVIFFTRSCGITELVTVRDETMIADRYL